MAETSSTERVHDDGLFVALGGIWLDEICAPGKPTLYDVPGGSVAFGKAPRISYYPIARLTMMTATFGAQLFSSHRAQRKRVGLIVKAGHDFPPTLEQTFQEWPVILRIIRDNDRPCPRGRIVYGETASERTYDRLTESFPSTPEDLVATNMISAACFHFFDVPATVSAQTEEILALRAQRQIESRPMYVWEPQAKSCSPETFEEHREVVKRVDVFSPNHAELALFFARPPDGTVSLDKATIEEQARAFFPLFSPHDICIIIRCAEHGCYVLTEERSELKGTWLPAYHPPGSDRVVDPTGAGNAFLGGVAHGLMKPGDFIRAAAYGSVAASFAVEHVGLPDVDWDDAVDRFCEYVGKHTSIVLMEGI